MKNKILIASIIAVLCFPFVIYLTRFPGLYSANSVEWGIFGTFIGGLLSSIFAGLSFIVVLLVYWRSNEDRKNRESRETVLKLLEELSNRYKKIVIRIEDTAQIGEMVFSYFNSSAFQLYKLYQDYLKNKENENLKGQVKAQALQMVFSINTIREYLRFVVLTYRYIVNKSIEKEFLSILSARLTEQEMIALSILLYDEIEADDNLFSYLKNMKYGPIEGYAAIGRSLTDALKLNSPELPSNLSL